MSKIMRDFNFGISLQKPSKRGIEKGQITDRLRVNSYYTSVYYRIKAYTLTP